MDLFHLSTPKSHYHWGDTKKKPGDRNQSRSCGNATYCFLCLACSASFLKQVRATCPWAVPPEVGFSLPYQSRKCQPRLAYKQSGWRHFLRSGYSRQGTVAWVQLTKGDQEGQRPLTKTYGELIMEDQSFEMYGFEQFGSQKVFYECQKYTMCDTQV